MGLFQIETMAMKRAIKVIKPNCFNDVVALLALNRPGCIIPYTYDNTNFRAIQPGTVVNIEFDIIGKYLARLQTLSGNGAA